ncbi:unnamed protein product [Urochloa humidicola]
MALRSVVAGGMSPMVFVVYRQAIATLVLAPIALISNRSMLKEMRLEMKGFFLVFMAALFGYKFLLIGHARWSSSGHFAFSVSDNYRFCETEQQ